jgi:transposase
MGRRSFSREFKFEAVKLVKERGVSVAQAAKDLGISQSVVGRWVREAGADPKQALPGRGQMKPDDAALRIIPAALFAKVEARRRKLSVADPRRKAGGKSRYIRCACAATRWRN